MPWDTPELHVGEKECSGDDPGSPLITVDKAVVLDDTEGVGGGESSGVRFAVGVQVLGTCESGVQHALVPETVGAAVLIDQLGVGV